MKTLIIPIAILFIISGFAVFEHFYVTNKFNSFEEQLDTLYIETLDETVTKDSVIKIENWWNNQKDKLHVFTPHTIIKDIEFWLAEIKGFINIKNFDFALVKIEMLKTAASAIPRSFTIDFGNIF